ncbi:Atxe2 family lasso peptide isopeptidase [Sphingopyxis flava]|uniref:Dipeptidyl aminopeptidase/acylaminoacyl peptidase n=1 Tax=Sphingopyxis flava TaxID=1507287 RepID=A0A1T5DUY8_9SPHN|nr:Atxe2 family lasso peptide isopeptidase [Sphingopyxis flava]SKB75340.1 Dipeptidyl aminopeptidase/acylaminoacyl peptidase [Sphingopyxis flava]
MVSRAALLIALLAATPPAAGQVTPRAIAEIADISGLAASPDGQWIAYRVERPSTLTNRIDVDWYIVPADGSAAPLHLGRTGEAWWDDAGVVAPGEAKWSSDSRHLVVRALIDGRIALWSSPVDGSGFELIAAGEGDIEAFAFGANGSLVTRQGPARDRIARAEEHERETGILVDGHTDLAQPLFRGALIRGRASSQRFSNDWFDRAPLLASLPRKTETRTLDGSERPATEGEAELLAPPPPSWLLLTSDLPTDIGAAVEARGVCKTKLGCPAEAPRLSWWLPRAGGDALVALRDADYRQSLLSWSALTRDLKLLASSPGLLSGSRFDFDPCAAATGAVFCIEAAPDIPPRLVRIDWSGKKRVIASPNPYPNPDRDGLLVETIAWQVSGSRASGVLIRPKFPGRLPLFVTYYNCAGYLRGGVGDEWPLRAMAAHGIAALCVNAVPGEGGNKRYARGTAAVEAAVELLADRGIVDAARVGMGGLSFGSEVTMWTAMHSDLLKAISIASVQMEPTYYWFNARPGRETFAETLRKTWDLGAPDETPARWKALSPARNIDRIKAPILMQFPEQEARLSIELVSRLATARMGETHIFPYAPHVKVEPRQKLAVYERNLDWFRYWLKGEKNSSPAKADQYRRWSKLGPRDTLASTARTQRSISPISINRK